jgi:hypothetical protein
MISIEVSNTAMAWTPIQGIYKLFFASKRFRWKRPNVLSVNAEWEVQVENLRFIKLREIFSVHFFNIKTRGLFLANFKTTN